jgi:hypothetical protein
MFEFDPHKSVLNKEKHGIDFESAKGLWKDTARVVIPARWVEEARFLIIAEMNGSIWSAIYTYRRKSVRIISVRRARDHEKEIYFGGGV